MVKLSAGVLLKLLDNMKTGAARPAGEHRALLQVTEMVPADLDEKALLPKDGQFNVKLSDASHSIYASLPRDQADLVLTDKLQVGQFVQVDRLERASPIPVVIGARPLPGRHPLVDGTINLAAEANPAASRSRRLSWCPEPNVCIKPAVGRRESWCPEPEGTTKHATPARLSCRSDLSLTFKPTALNCDADHELPASELPAPERRNVRRTWGSGVVPRWTWDRKDRPNIPRPPTRTSKISQSPLPIEKSTIDCTPSRSTRPVLLEQEELSSPPSDGDLGSSAKWSKKRLAVVALAVPVPGMLSLLGMEAMERKDRAQKAVVEALHNCSAAEKVARIYMIFSELSSTAMLDAPASCFESFLSFHHEAVQAIREIEAMQVPTLMAAATVARDECPDARPALREISQNISTMTGSSFSGSTVSKSVSFAAGTAMDKINDDGGEEKRLSSSAPPPANTQSTLGSSLKLVKQIHAEAGSWFLDFLEATLETGQKKNKASATGDRRKRCCPQSLMFRVIEWVETQQSGSDTRAAQIAGKLRTEAS